MKDTNYDRVIRLQDMPTGGSDLLLKKDITVIQNVLQRVLALRPVTWRWKASQDDQITQYGFIAQEVEKLFPDIIKHGKWHGKAAKLMSTHDLLPYAIEAIKEQSLMIEATQQQLDILKAEIRALQQQLEAKATGKS